MEDNNFLVIISQNQHLKLRDNNRALPTSINFNHCFKIQEQDYKVNTHKKII